MWLYLLTWLGQMTKSSPIRMNDEARINTSPDNQAVLAVLKTLACSSKWYIVCLRQREYPSQKETSELRTRYDVNRYLQWLIRSASAVTVLGLGCTTAMASHTYPVAPILGLGIQKHANAAHKHEQRDVFATAESLARVDAEGQWGQSIPDNQPSDASSSAADIVTQRLATENLQGSGFRIGDTSVLKRSALVVRGVAAVPPQGGESSSFNWDGAIRQSLLFLSILHAFRFTTEPDTRAAMRGPFWKDYFRSVGSLRGWGDGDEFLVNYIGHPIEGAVAGFIQVQNDPKGVRQQVGFSKAYWRSRVKAFAWSAAFSTQFELGFLSEASLGNVGLRPGKKSNHPLAYGDLVVTPVLGTAWLVGEDLIDRYVIQRLENKIKSRWVRAVIRSVLNPTRSLANMHRGEWFWHRDTRSLPPF